MVRSLGWVEPQAFLASAVKGSNKKAEQGFLGEELEQESKKLGQTREHVQQVHTGARLKI